MDGGNNIFVYTENNPINFVDPYGLWTLGIDLSGTVGAGGAATGGYTYVIDSNLNIARIDHSGGGGLGGATGSVAAQIQWTNVSSIRDLEGTSVSTGGSALPGVSPTAEWIVMPGGYQGVNIGVAGGPSTLVELHSMVEGSKIAWEINLIDIVIDWLKGSGGKDPCERE